MSSLVRNEFVADVARDQVAQVAPQEEMVFGIISEAYFQDPNEALKRRVGKDEMLGFGVEAGVVLLTPVILTVTKEVIEFLAGEVMKSVQTQSSGIINEFVKMFKKFRREERATGGKLPPPLTREQIARVRVLALEKGRQLRLSEDQAGLLADSLVGSLATAA
jgi:hypothetical protein